MMKETLPVGWNGALGGSIGSDPGGQAIVEVLLILPVFLALVFSIMEIGHLSFRTILIHHAAYEAARVGSLTAQQSTTASCATPTLATSRIQQVAQSFLTKSSVQISYGPTVQDPQDQCMNYDVDVTVEENVPLVFPLSGLFLGKKCDGGKSSSYRCISATVRMPIERPLFK